ncbi:MAG TPA: amidohydrolase family protein [Candidatus Limnocylindria bacterium]|jgi:predicted TIM-barrel fold metal-dependent hydrolase|nr:amidohydrolase family protein [Candidatus Limnocylindria bacterium]
MKIRRVKFKHFALLLAGLGLSVLAGCVLFFKGPYQPPVALPAAKLLDVHCHTAGIGAGGSGCFVSRELERSYKFGIYLKAFGVTREQLASKGDSLIIRRISERLSGSSKVGQAIVLALDGVVNDAGELDHEQTQAYVPNEFVAAETAKFTNLLWGASINPYRQDALARLDWAAVHGAKLIKWIPSTMHIDPADERLAPFYRRMVELRLPLLCHAGQERSFVGARDELADPVRLELPLKLGVTVIAAHIASTGADEGERDTDRLARMMAAHPNLYSEISSLTQANKLGYLREALVRPEFSGRLLYGTDFPLVNTALVSPWFYPLNLTRAQMSEIAAIENPWDRDVALKQALGVPPEILQRSAALLLVKP